VYARAAMRMSDGPRPEGKIDFAARDADIDVLKYNIDMWQTETAALRPLDGDNKVVRLF